MGKFVSCVLGVLCFVTGCCGCHWEMVVVAEGTVAIQTGRRLDCAMR